LPANIAEQGEKETTVATAAPSAMGKGLPTTTSMEQESPPPSTLQQRLNAFLLAYCRAYSAQDLEAFARFFDLAAIENGKPFLELHDTYRRLFASTRERTLVISSQQWENDGGNIHLHGRFTISLVHDNGETVHGAGVIDFLLIGSQSNLQIKTMNYSFD
jgi:hypothetical protein